jgi:uncharacterized membrane protein YkoI
MKTHILALALVGVLAVPAAAQDAAKPQSTQAAQVEIKVSKTLAHSVKVSGDSAMAIARATAEGEVSSAALTMEDKRLVYNVKLLTKGKRATEVAVDAMSGEVVKNKELGGLKATLTHRDENKKLMNAKKDSAMKAPYSRVSARTGRQDLASWPEYSSPLADECPTRSPRRRADHRNEPSCRPSGRWRQ